VRLKIWVANWFLSKTKIPFNTGRRTIIQVYIHMTKKRENIKYILHTIMQINLHPSQVSYAFLLQHLEAYKYLQDSYISPVMYRHKLFSFCELSHHLAHTGAEIWNLYSVALTYDNQCRKFITQSFTSANISLFQYIVHTIMKMLTTFYKGYHES
jgi:hypothetical protein